MRLNALELFLELSQAESIRQTARSRGVKPSVVSRQIGSLEHYFRAELFDRNAEGIRLTEAGRLLVGFARVIMADVRNARGTLDDLRGLERGEVVVYAGGAPATGVLASVVAGLHRRHPRLRFTLHATSSNEVQLAVADGVADLGFTMFSSDLSKVDLKHRVKLEHVLIMSRNHPFAGLERVLLRRLAEIPLALPDPSFGARRSFEALLARQELQLEPAFVCNSLSVQKELAIGGAAALLLPVMCCQRELSMGLLAAVPLEKGEELTTTLDLFCAKRRTLPFAARTLADALVQAMNGLPCGLYPPTDRERQLPATP